MIAMLLSGAVAGLVGMVDILSRNHRYDQNFTPGLGFAGIAVALLGRNNPVGIACRRHAVRLPRRLVEHPPDHRIGVDARSSRSCRA